MVYYCNVSLYINNLFNNNKIGFIMTIIVSRTEPLNPHIEEDNSTLNAATHSGREFKVLSSVDSKVQEILKALNNREIVVSWETKNKLFSDLGNIRDVGEVPELIHALHYKGWTRRFAADALGKIRDARVVPALIKALNDEDGNFLYHVVGALGKIRDARAVPVLIKALNDVQHFEEENDGVYEDFRYFVVKALVKIAVQIEKMESEEEFKDIVINKIKVNLEKPSLPFDPSEALSRDLETFNELISAYESMIENRIENRIEDRGERIEYDIQQGYLGNITQNTIPHHILG